MSFEVLHLKLYPQYRGENEDLLVWLTFPGEEYFLHMSLWREAPFRLKLDKQTESADLAIQKVVRKELDDGCNSNIDYDYMGEYFLVFFQRMVL